MFIHHRWLFAVGLLWTFEKAVCESTNGCIIPTLRNAQVMSRNITCPPGSMIEAGRMVILTCARGFEVESSSSNNSNKFVCMEGGNWFPGAININCRIRPRANISYDECGLTAAQTRWPIFGGDNATIFELPWMAKLDLMMQVGPAKQCGAFVISSRWLLTAAHCVALGAEPPISITVRLGRTNFSSTDELEHIYTTATYCSHPAFDQNDNYNYDFALVYIGPGVKFSDRVRPICLPNASQCSSNYYTADVDTVDGCNSVSSAGWGLKNSNNTPPNLSPALRKVSLKITSKAKCPTDTLSEAQICAEGAKDGDDTCDGDSGGPLVCMTSNKAVAIGVVSSGSLQCGTAPAIYSRICSALPWIHKTTSGNGTCSLFLLDEQQQLCEAAYTNNVSLVKQQLSKKYLDVDWRESKIRRSCNGFYFNVENATALQLAVYCNSSLEIISMLVDAGANISLRERGEFAQRPINMAAWNGNVGVVRLLLDHGADIETKDAYENTPLLDAAWFNRVEVIRLLLNRGSNIKAVDKFGMNALMNAAQNGSVEMVPLLLDAGLPINGTETFGWTAMMVAAMYGHTDFAKALIDRGCNINHKSDPNYSCNECSALMVAARFKKSDTVKMFVQKGADRIGCNNSDPKFNNLCP